MEGRRRPFSKMSFKIRIFVKYFQEKQKVEGRKEKED